MLTAGRGEIRDMLERSVLTIDGVQTPIAQGGAKDAPNAVVFVHGNPGPSEDWDELAPRAAEFARVLTMDMPGYGRADRPRDFDYTMAGYARHLEGILKATGIDGAHLVTHDFGHARAVCRLYRARCDRTSNGAEAPRHRSSDPGHLGNRRRLLARDV